MRIAVVGTGHRRPRAPRTRSRARTRSSCSSATSAPGGHTNTIAATTRLALDTGFIVHNERNYPTLVRLFRELGIRTQDSDMSFSVSCARHRLEYVGPTTARPARRPAGSSREIVRFLREARGTIDRAREQTLGALRRPSTVTRPQFRDHFLVPLTSAIWSSGTGAALDFPAAYALGFFDNHGMLGFRRHRWRTVVGGSRAYVRGAARALAG